MCLSESSSIENYGATRKSTYEVARDLAVAGFGDELKGGRHLGRWFVLGEGHPHAAFRLAADARLAAEREQSLGQPLPSMDFQDFFFDENDPLNPGKDDDNPLT